MYRFWDKVRKSDTCWLWVASKDSSGYGLFRFEGKVHKAHRVSWFLAYGEHPKFCVLHKCDTPACVNPDHLFSGTRALNAFDRDNKGRQVSTKTRPKKRRIQDQNIIAEVRLLRSIDVTYAELSARFDVSTTVIHNIEYGKCGYK